MTAAEHGAEALALTAAATFDLVLLDLMMPGMSGFEVLCKLKSNTATRQIPVIMISALDELDSTVRCIEAGAEDYLHKPFNPFCCAPASAPRGVKKRLLDELRVEKERSEALLVNILPAFHSRAYAAGGNGDCRPHRGSDHTFLRSCGFHCAGRPVVTRAHGVAAG